LQDGGTILKKQKRSSPVTEKSVVLKWFKRGLGGLGLVRHICNPSYPGDQLREKLLRPLLKK
jgi:hypothetical protein